MANKRKVLAGVGMAVSGANGLFACAHTGDIAHGGSDSNGADNGRFSTHARPPAHLHASASAHADGSPDRHPFGDTLIHPSTHA